MAYTRAWSETTPTDSDLRNQVDDFFRNLKVDIRERMNALVVDWTADPVVPRDIINGAVTGKFLYIAGCEFQPAGNAFGQLVVGESDGSLIRPADTAGYNAWKTLNLPHGVTITEIGINLDNPRNENITLTLYRTSWGGTAPSSIGLVTGVDTGVWTGDVANHVVDANYHYSLKIGFDGSGGGGFVTAAGKLIAARVKYNTPDVRSVR